jgi:hypothetical protein
MKALLVCCLSFFFASVMFAADQPTFYPSSWWTGMKNKNLQLMIHGKEVANYSSVKCMQPGVSLKQVHRLKNKNYLILDLVIESSAKPGMMSVQLSGGTQPNYTTSYELKARRKGNGTLYANGATSSDLIYLIMPDRFSNGDPSNDRVPGMKDQSLRRDTVFNRHGGDLQGVENKLDYLHDLGVTALWLNPIWENDMPERTEHGYAFTNHYKVDPR